MSSDDRLQRMTDDPEAYFAEARARARAMVERDMERERERRRQERRTSRRAKLPHVHWFRYDGYDFLRGGIYFCRCGELRYGAGR